jgi:hypothetical protein
MLKLPAEELNKLGGIPAKHPRHYAQHSTLNTQHSTLNTQHSTLVVSTRSLNPLEPSPEKPALAELRSVEPPHSSQDVSQDRGVAVGPRDTSDASQTEAWEGTL